MREDNVLNANNKFQSFNKNDSVFDAVKFET